MQRLVSALLFGFQFVFSLPTVRMSGVFAHADVLPPLPSFCHAHDLERAHNTDNMMSGVGNKSNLVDNSLWEDNNVIGNELLL